ncbi:hypothetical protein TEK04_19490 [Klenkia sp. LSe6-5]|uniref:Uncharacterized protein n=1 Tax=Klenkia sesuvii TaxID=3103137 RepID=A0ABU8DYJ6_9ACTN
MTAREKRPCLHPRVQHEHGTRLAYALDRCRCLPCSAANSAYEGARARAKAYGRPTTTWVDAGPARVHVEQLQAAGLGWKRVAAVAGVHGSAVSRLIYGRKRENGKQEPPPRRIKGDVARALLAVPIPAPDQLLGGAKVDGTGTRRRLQALVAIGYPLSRLAGRLGMEPGNFSRVIAADVVVASTHRAVAALYDELWDQPQHAGCGATRARRRAEHEGWPPPAAWDDDTIDDPAAGPHLDDDDQDVVDELVLDRIAEGAWTPVRGATAHAAVHLLAERGISAAETADRLSLDERQVQRLRARTTPPRPRAVPSTGRSAA